MALSITTTVEPAIEPVTVQTLKRHLRIDWPDDDEYLADLITDARLWLERKLNRALITRTLRATFDLPFVEAAQGSIGGVIAPYPRLAFDLPYAPLGTVSSAELEQDIELWKALALSAPGGAGDYLVDSDNEPARVWLHSSALAVWMPSWDWTGARAPRIRVTYTAGYGATTATVPGPMRRAIQAAAAHMYENREAAGALPDALLPTEYLLGWL